MLFGMIAGQQIKPSFPGTFSIQFASFLQKLKQLGQLFKLD